MPDNWEEQKQQAQSPFHDKPVTAPRSVNDLSITILRGNTELHEAFRPNSDLRRSTSPYNIEQSFIIAPENAREWVYDREELWKRAELPKSGESAPIACVVLADLPYESSKEEHVRLVRGFIEETFVKHGLVADVDIRYPNSLGNDFSPYASIMLTTRELDGENFAVQQQRNWYSPEMWDAWRQSWTEYQPDALKETQPYDPLTAFHKEPSQVIGTMTEHEALGLAIDALKQVPNHELQGAITGDYSEVRNLLPALEDVYQREQEILREQEWQQWAHESSISKPERDRDLEPDL